MKDRETSRRLCLEVPSRLGENAILVCRKHEVLDGNYKISRKRKAICLPLSRELTEEEVQDFRREISDLRLGEQEFEQDPGRRKSVKEVLENTLPPELLEELPRAMPTVGDLAIVEIPKELASFDEQIGDAILTTNPGLKTVLAKTSKIGGLHRTREFKVLAGEKRTTTIHREYGSVFYMDLSKVYFNPKLSYERNRVSNCVGEGETILDMFAGIGPFSIQIAKRIEKVKIFAVDINPIAIEYLCKNIDANRVQDRIIPIEGDVRRIVQKDLHGKADRAIMNLPGSSASFVDTACLALKRQGGVVHYYQFAHGRHPIQEAKATLVRNVEATGRSVEAILAARKVVATAPREWQVGIDAHIS